MCTVTVIPFRGGVRMVCSRDEARNRASARPPSIVEQDGVRAILPRDPESGGTWIAVTDAGLAFAVLNVNADGGPASLSHRRSRGGIIPPLLASRSVNDALATLGGIDMSVYRPFRLIVADYESAFELRQGTRPVRYDLAVPRMFTSSGLGDRLVEGPRRELFDRMMRAGGSLAARQDRFHAHRWRSRPQISVSMERADARTVSRTVVESGAGRMRMAYVTVGEHTAPAQTIECSW